MVLRGRLTSGAMLLKDFVLLASTERQSQKDKMNDLRQCYKDLKDGHNRSGHNHSSWPYYDLMDNVLAERLSTKPRNIIDTPHLLLYPPQHQTHHLMIAM